MMGEGLVYTTPESQIIEDLDPRSFPTHWRWGWGIDLGMTHPFAAVLECWDVDQQVIHLVGEIRMSNEIPSAHVAGMRELEKRLSTPGGPQSRGGGGQRFASGIDFDLF